MAIDMTIDDVIIWEIKFWHQLCLCRKIAFFRVWTVLYTCTHLQPPYVTILDSFNPPDNVTWVHKKLDRVAPLITDPSTAL